MAQSTSTGRAEVRKIPPMARVNAEEGTQTVRILVARGLTDIKEQIRHTMQRWLDMVDWRAVRVGSTTAQRKLSVEWYLKRGAGQVRADHPARTWVERQEGRAVQGTRTNGTLDARACAELMQKAIEEGRGGENADGQKAMSEVAAAINAGRHPDAAARGILRLVRTSKVDKAETIQLMHLIRSCLLYTSPSPRDRQKSRMPSSA